MAFIGKGTKGASYNPGWFLVDDEDCTRITWEFDAEGGYVVTTDDGAKYVPMGSIIETNDGIAGIAYEDVDVTEGNMPGSLVTKGAIYVDRLLDEGEPLTPAGITEVTNTLIGAGYGVAVSPKVTRTDGDGGED